MAPQTGPGYSEISRPWGAAEGDDGPAACGVHPSGSARRRRWAAAAAALLASSGAVALAVLGVRGMAPGPVAAGRGRQSLRLVGFAEEVTWGFVDGGLGRECRDEDSSSGTEGSTFDLHENVVSVDECKALCLDAKACTGIEYNTDLSRCEVWLGAIGGGKKAEGYACLKKGGTEKPAVGSSDDADKPAAKKPEKAKAEDAASGKKGDGSAKPDKKDDEASKEGSDGADTKDAGKEHGKASEESGKPAEHAGEEGGSHEAPKEKKRPCAKQFTVPPKPKTATEHNGVALTDVCIEGDGPHHVFLIGDWGGIPAEGGKISCAPHLNSRWNDTKPYAFVWPPDENAQFRVRDEMRKRAVDSDPDYVLNVGDDFYWAGINDQCGSKDIATMYSNGGNGVYKHLPVDQFKDEFENVYTGQGLDGKPWLGVLGNHDYGGWLFNSAWDQIIGYTWSTAPHSTGRWVNPAMYYSATVRYPGFSVDYYFMDTNLFDALEPGNPSPHNICSQQHNEQGASCAPVGPAGVDGCQQWFRDLWTNQKIWLGEVVPKSEGHWRIVVTHFPPYWGEGEWRELTGKHHFDLVISGHRHVQNTHKKGDPPTQIWTNDPNKLMDDFLDPVAWVVTGGGGGVTSEHTPHPGGEDDQYGFMDMTLTKSHITVDAISHGGQVRRSMRIEPQWPHNPHHARE